MAAQFLSTQAAGIAASEQALTKYAAALKELGKAAQLIQQSEAQEQVIGKSLQAGQSDRVALNGAQLQTAVTKVAQVDALYRAQQALGDLENAVQRPLLPVSHAERKRLADAFRKYCPIGRIVAIEDKKSEKPDFADAVVYGIEGPEALINAIQG